MTIFKKIIDKKIPAKIVYEDDQCLAFRDINPQAPVHILLIPKKEIANLEEIQASDSALMGHLLTKISEIAKKEGISENGYRVVLNCKDDGGQEVPHLHFHILGGRLMKWPPG